MAMPARVENREEGDSRGYHLWGPKRVTVSVQASVGYVGVDIKIWLVVVSRRLLNHRSGCRGTCGGASDLDQDGENSRIEVTQTVSGLRG